MKDICGNCIYFNKSKKMINGLYICEYHKTSTEFNNLGCYKIQFSKIKK